MGEPKIAQPWQGLQHLALQTDQIVEGEIEVFEVGLVGEHVGREGDDIHAGHREGFQSGKLRYYFLNFLKQKFYWRKC